MHIELRDVHKRFGTNHVLRGIRLDIPSGRRIGLIGPNGSGKSTLTRVMMGMLSCEGTVRLDGQAPSAPSGELLRRIAYVPQIAPQLFAPVGEVLRAVCELRDLPAARIRDLAHGLGLDVEALAARPFRNLSGGMKQKLLIAVALAARASFLILDEPTASLDAWARDRFFRLFQEIQEGATLILCSHRLEEVRHLVDHVVAMEDGNVVYDGSADAFLSQRALSVIEVSLDAGAESGWLLEQGFRPGVRGESGRWLRTVTRADKMRALASLTERLGSQLKDFNVRELETLDVAQGANLQANLQRGTENG
jgi:ABC-2 type transport system ATP-binding protein